MGVDHPLCPIVVQCLQDIPGARPTIRKLWEDMSFLFTKHKKYWKNSLEVHVECIRTLSLYVQIRHKYKGASASEFPIIFRDRNNQSK